MRRKYGDSEVYVYDKRKNLGICMYVVYLGNHVNGILQLYLYLLCKLNIHNKTCQLFESWMLKGIKLSRNLNFCLSRSKCLKHDSGHR